MKPKLSVGKRTFLFVIIMDTKKVGPLFVTTESSNIGKNKIKQGSKIEQKLH